MVINGRNFRIDHDDDGITIENNICERCRCSNGQFGFCSRVRCPYMSDAGTRSCTVDGNIVAIERPLKKNVILADV